jgi:CheY-like chemotaxis protein
MRRHFRKFLFGSCSDNSTATNRLPAFALPTPEPCLFRCRCNVLSAIPRLRQNSFRGIPLASNSIASRLTSSRLRRFRVSTSWFRSCAKSTTKTSRILGAVSYTLTLKMSFEPARRAKLHLKHLMSDKKKTIVIVDDQPLFRERLTQLLNQELDIEVREEAENVEQAIPLIRKTSPDLAIANITLKGLSGLELIKSIKALSIGVPVLVLSPHDDSLYAERALRAGAAG